MRDEDVAAVDEFLAPADSGVVDANSGTAGVSITLAVGASLFDNRFDLSDQRPRELIPMPNFFNDRLVRDELSHGDLSLTITAADRQAVGRPPAAWCFRPKPRSVVIATSNLKTQETSVHNNRIQFLLQRLGFENLSIWFS